MGKSIIQVLITGDSTGLTKALSESGGDVDKFSTKMQDFGTKMSTHVTLPLVAVGAAAISMAADFETALNTFQAATGATVQQMDKVSEAAKRLGADVKLPGTSAKDAALAMTELAKAGLTVEEALKAARAVLVLSAAAIMDNAKAAELVANTLNTFGLKAAEAARVVDLLAGAANASSANIEDVAQALQQAGAVFAASKVPVEDLATAIGLMANAGIKGSDAGTSLKTMLLSLVAPSTEAAKQLEKMGIAIFDADGNMRPFKSIVEDFNRVLPTMTDEQRAAALATIFGTDAVRAANIVLGSGVEKWEEMFDAVTKGGQAQEMADAKTKGTRGSMDALKSSVESLAIAFGEHLAPAILPVITALTKFITVFGSLPDSVQIGIVAIVALAAAVGPIMTVIGGLATIFVAAAAAVGAVWPLLVGTVLALKDLAAGATIVSAPIGAIVVGVAALAAGLVFLYAKFDLFRDVVNKMIELAITPARIAIDLLLDAFKAIASVVDAVVDLIKAIFTGKWGEAWDALKQIAGAVIEFVKNTVENGLGKIISLFGELPGKILGFLVDLPGKLAGAIGNIFGFLPDAFKTAIGALGPLMGGLIEGIVGWFKDLPGKLASAVGDLFVFLPNLMNFTKKFLLEHIDGIVSWFAGLPGRLVSAVGDMFFFLVNLLSYTKNFFLGHLDEIVNWFKGLPGRLIDAVGDMFVFLVNLLAFSKTWLLGHIDGIVDWFKKLPGRLVGVVGDMFVFLPNLIHYAKGWLLSHIDEIVNWFKGLPGRLLDAAVDLFGFIPKAFTKAVNWLIEKWNDLHLTIGGWQLPFPPHTTLPSVTIDTPNLPKLPEYAAGGFVPGAIGSPQLAVVHGGEEVIPVGGRRRGGTVINLTVNAYGTERQYVMDLIEALKRELRIQAVAI